MEDSGTVISDATAQDAETLARIIRGAFQDVALRFGLTSENCPRHPSNCSAGWITSDMARGVRYYLLHSGGQAAGCAAMEHSGDGVVYLKRLAVLPCHRRRGLGGELVDHVLVKAREAGARKVSVGIIADHTELGAWYRGLGFHEEGSKDFPHLPFRVAFLSRPP